jgi:hypothetical protein
MLEHPRLDDGQWKFPLADPTARAELSRRIAATGKKRALITYSELVEGVLFTLPTVNNGDAFAIDTSDWRELDRMLVGEFLGAIATESYKLAGFFASALVVNRETQRPSAQFFKWMRDLGIIRGRGEDPETEFWAAEVTRAHDWYSAN